ncbi:DNA cytosine methyltransferase [Microvirga sp. VF16]|uniref:DNA cytosine methyltransferase n=1 Tax=Microvirga sp. VF16 TaxID=2807101 RepID=UPI001FED6446|nr:DNA cytosine methyltransferase [Microvirga sp. VF16]
MSKIQAVDLFCGAGGLSYGLKKAGIEIRAGIDLDPACCFPFERNIKASFIEEDVGSLDGNTVQELFDDEGIRVLAGCAPCQPFSRYTTGKGTGDERWQLLLDFLRIVDEIRPEIVTLENVPGLSRLALWKHFVSSLETSGYHVVWDVLNTAHYGVPQNRNRLVLMASRLGKIEMPKRHSGRSRTVWSCIGNLPPVSAGSSNDDDPLHRSRALTPINVARIKASRPAGTWREWPEEMRVACHQSERGRTYPSVYGRMSWSQPSPTITTQFYGFGNGRFGHPEQDRALTLREGAMLQSFPKTFEFVPRGQSVSFREIGRLIGNAVPPALGRAIGQAIIRHVIAASSASA